MPTHPSNALGFLHHRLVRTCKEGLDAIIIEGSGIAEPQPIAQVANPDLSSQRTTNPCRHWDTHPHTKTQAHAHAHAHTQAILEQVLVVI